MDTQEDVRIMRSERIIERIKAEEHGIRKDMARRISWLFLIGNLFVIIVISVSFYYDITLLQENKISSEGRLVDAKVLMALIGATTVQVGALMLSISGYFFKHRKEQK